MSEKRIAFTKMHGAGNDYIYVNTLLYDVPNPEQASLVWSRYHTGIGSDGLVLIGTADEDSGADFSMRIFNADGSEALMCGNASRCIGKYVYEHGLTEKRKIVLQTLSGNKILDLHTDAQGKVTAVTVDMDMPRLHDEKLYDEACGGVIVADGRSFEGTFVSMGNPHFVCFIDDVENFDVAHYGPLMENDKAFPERCNIEFATVLPNGDIRFRVWERGSGITMACGTGACATAVAAAHTGRARRKSHIIMDGGRLEIDWRETDGHVYMTGGATFVFEGEIDLP